MSLFDDCMQPGCGKISSIKCTSQDETRDLCPKHAGRFIYKRGLHVLPNNLNAPISTRDCGVINEVSVDDLSTKLVIQIEEARNRRIKELLQEIARANQECLQLVTKTLTAGRVVQKELDMLVLHKTTPLNKPNHFADAVTQLKRQNTLNKPNLEGAIEHWMQTCDLAIEGVDVDMDLTPPRPVARGNPVVAPASQPVVQPAAQPIVQPADQPVAPPVVPPVAQPPAQPVNALVQLARDHGRDPQSPKEAVEFLCSLNFVFDPTRTPGLSLEGLDLSGADLSGGVFIGVSFERSNLQGAKLENAILWNTSLKMCKLESVTVSPPSRQTNWILRNVAYSPCGRFVAFGGMK